MTPALRVTWSFRNHSNILICCSRNISDYYQCWNKTSIKPFFSFSGLFWCQSAARSCKRQPGSPAEVRIRSRWLLHRSHAARPGVHEELRRPSGRGHVWLHLHAQGRERLSGEGEEGEETAHRAGGRLSSRGVLYFYKVFKTSLFL